MDIPSDRENVCVCVRERDRERERETLAPVILTSKLCRLLLQEPADRSLTQTPRVVLLMLLCLRLRMRGNWFAGVGLLLVILLIFYYYLPGWLWSPR